MLAGWEGQYCQIPHRQSVGQSGTMLPKPSVLLIVLNLEHRAIFVLPNVKYCQMCLKIYSHWRISVVKITKYGKLFPSFQFNPVLNRVPLKWQLYFLRQKPSRVNGLLVK